MDQIVALKANHAADIVLKAPAGAGGGKPAIPDRGVEAAESPRPIPALAAARERLLVDVGRDDLDLGGGAELLAGDDRHRIGLATGRAAR